MKYELVVILKPDTEQKAETTKLTNLLEKAGFTLSNVEWIAKKVLAYPIKKHLEANYVFCNITAANKNPNDIYKTFKSDDNVLRALVLKLEE